MDSRAKRRRQLDLNKSEPRRIAWIRPGSRHYWAKLAVLVATLTLLVAVFGVKFEIFPDSTPKLVWAMSSYPFDDGLDFCSLKFDNETPKHIRRAFIQTQTPGRVGEVRVDGAEFEFTDSHYGELISVIIYYIPSGTHVELYWMANVCSTKEPHISIVNGN